MLDVSRVSSGDIRLERHEIDFVALIRESARAILYPLDRAGQLTLLLPEKLLLWVDPVRIEQVIENLFTNALKYGENKPVKIYLEIEEKEVILTVEDQGIGIAPEFHSRIFDRFERGRSAKNIAGLGLGLYIVRQIVEAHSGSIEVDSLPGAGASFKVRLPLGRS